MNEDTNSTMQETADVDAAIDSIFDSDEEIEVTTDDETTEESSEAAEENPEATEKTEEAKPETKKLTYKGETREYTPAEIEELALKGLDYDGLRADRDRLRDHDPARELLNRYAKANGMTLDQYIRRAQDEADLAEARPEIDRLVETGTPEDVAKELVLRRMQDTRRQNEQKTKTEAEQLRKAQTDKAFGELAEYAQKNGISLSELPQEVLTEIAKGKAPLTAYLEHHTAQLELQLKQQQQNEKNKQKNPGATGTDHNPKPKSGFDAGFDSVFGF